MLFPVNVARRLILLAVDLLLLARRQRAAMGLAVRSHLLVDALLLLFELGGFFRGQLPALHALGHAVLLIFAPLPHLVVAEMRGVGVVLVSVNLLGHLILLLIDLGLFCSRQFAPVRCAIRARLFVDGRFRLLEISGFAGS